MTCNDSSNCIDSCDQINGLFEAASNLVQYRDIIEKWLHGKQNETVQIGGEQIKTLLGLIADIKQLVGVLPDGRTIVLDDKRKVLSVLLAEGGGIKVKAEGGLYVDVDEILVLGGGLTKDEDGKIYVDFSQMPTDKFEALLKQIRVPIWLTANKNFYVNGTTGSDTLDNGRGESEGKPFRTLQACVTYVCDNYNISRFTLTIHVADGEYSAVNLSNFNATTGKISIVGKGSTRTIIKAENNGCIQATGGKWYLYDIGLECIARDAGSSTGYIETGLIYCYTYSDVTIYRGVSGKVSINDNIKNYRGSVRGVYSGSNSNLTIRDITLETIKQSTGFGKNIAVHAITVNSAVCNFLSNSYNAVCATINGDFYSTITSDVGGVVNVNNTNMPTFEGSCTGYRYIAKNGGVINTGGRGPELFPGLIAGTADSNRYSWYN